MFIFTVFLLCYSVWGCTAYTLETISYATMNDTQNAYGFLLATLMHLVALIIGSVALGRMISNFRNA